MERKYRQCPHCKSKKGFSYNYVIGGFGTIAMDFKGKLISTERSGSDDLDKYTTCLSCNKDIEIDRLQTD